MDGLLPCEPEAGKGSLCAIRDYRGEDGLEANQTVEIIANPYTRLENAECIKKYSTTFVSDYHDVILVTEPVDRTSGSNFRFLGNFSASLEISP